MGDNGASVIGDLMWFGPMKRFQKLFFHTPLVNAFIFGSEAYHDYYRWPMKDQRTFETWKTGHLVGQALRRLRARRGGPRDERSERRLAPRSARVASLSSSAKRRTPLFPQWGPSSLRSSG